MADKKLYIVSPDKDKKHNIFKVPPIDPRGHHILLQCIVVPVIHFIVTTKIHQR